METSMAAINIQGRECVVYWLYDDQCVCLWRHGYVGISIRWKKRLKRHVARRKNAFKWKILFRGSLVDCLKYESILRPSFGIGWNEAPGGEHGGGSAPKKEATKLKMSLSALRRYSDPVEKIKTQAAVKAAFIDVDRSGANNSHFGHSLSAVSRQNISRSRKGKALGNQNWKKRKSYSEEARKKMSEASIKRWELHRITKSVRSRADPQKE
jgi:hypothetical protein